MGTWQNYKRSVLKQPTEGNLEVIRNAVEEKVDDGETGIEAKSIFWIC